MGPKRKDLKKKKKGPRQKRAKQGTHSRSRSPQTGSSDHSYDDQDQQPSTSGLNDDPPLTPEEEAEKELIDRYAIGLLAEIQPGLAVIDEDCGEVDHRPLIEGMLNKIDGGLKTFMDRDPQEKKRYITKHRQTFHDLRKHVQACLENYEDFVVRGERPAADPEDIDPSVPGPSGLGNDDGAEPIEEDDPIDQPGPSLK